MLQGMIEREQQEKIIVHYAVLLLHFSDKSARAAELNANTPTTFSVDYDK